MEKGAGEQAWVISRRHWVRGSSQGTWAEGRCQEGAGLEAVAAGPPPSRGAPEETQQKLKS